MNHEYELNHHIGVLNTKNEEFKMKMDEARKLFGVKNGEATNRAMKEIRKQTRQAERQLKKKY